MEPEDQTVVAPENGQAITPTQIAAPASPIDFAQPPEAPAETPAAPAPAQAPSPEEQAILAQSAELSDAAAQKGNKAEHEILKKAREAEEAGQLGAAQEVQAATQESQAAQPELDKAIDEQKTLELAQRMHQQDYETKLQQLQIETQETTKQMEEYLRDAHPTDIYKAAGVNNILGRIAVGLSGINSAINGGPNQVFDLINAKAQFHAHQIAEEGHALGMKSSFLGQKYNQLHQILGDRNAATSVLQGLLKDQLATSMKAIVNKYAPAHAVAAANQTVAKLKNDAAGHVQQGYAMGMQGLHAAMTGNAAALHYIGKAHDAVQADKVMQRQIQIGKEATSQAINLINQWKNLAHDPITRARIEAQLGPLLAKADMPGSNRILTEGGRETELSKLRGPVFGNATLGGWLTGDPDGLIKQLKTQQQLREQSTVLGAPQSEPGDGE